MDLPVVLAEAAIVEPLRWGVRGAFVALALAGVVQWTRARMASSGWLAGLFGSVATVLVIGAFGLDPTASTTQFLVHKLQLSAVIAIPYALYRFMRTFLPPDTVAATIVNVLTAATFISVLLVPEPPSTDPGASPLQVAAIVLILAQFVVVSFVAAFRLWWAGYSLPPVARGRMRTLAIAAMVLALALLLAPFNAPGIAVGIQSAALLAALLFYAGFAPPDWLRGLWRGSITPVIQSAEQRLAVSLTREDVGSTITPLLREAFAARGAALIDGDGTLLAYDGHHPGGEGSSEQTLVEPVSGGSLVVEPGVFAPRYGEDEADLLDTFGTITSLALERADLFGQERDARQAIEAAHAELEALVFGLSHDLKNPIISLLGYAELLHEDHADSLGDEGRTFLDRMVANANYMQQLLNDLLELSRVGRVQTESKPVALRPVAEAVRDEVARGHPGATVEVADALPTVEMNPVRARQLLTNLVENAVRHGGREDITVRVETEPSGPDEAVLLVVDDGEGIPTEHRERIFGIFERMSASDRDAGGGTGIGLAVCRRIVESFGGTIAARDVDVGATIEVTLPRPADGVGGGDRDVDEERTPGGAARHRISAGGR